MMPLQTGGPSAFAAALAGDADTPELIWTHRMRGQRLVPQVLLELCKLHGSLLDLRQLLSKH